MNTTRVPAFSGFMSNSLQFLFQKLKERISATPHNPFLKRLVFVPDKYSKAALQLKLAQELPHKVIFGTTFLLPHEAKSVTFQDTLSESYINESQAEKRAEDLFLYRLYNLAEKGETVFSGERARDILDNFDEIHLFNFSALCPNLHQRLVSRSSAVSVTYYINSPCMLFWSDIASDREARRLERIDNPGLQDALRPLLYNRSKLLANNANLAREFTQLLELSVEAFNEHYLVSEWVTKDPCYSQYLRTEIEINKASNSASLLEAVQAELLLLGPKREEKINLSKDDRSVQFHRSPTLFREVEVLYQNIQEFTSTSPPLGAGHIVVLAPDIAKYRPYIESLFTLSYQVLGDKKGEIYSCFLEMLELSPDNFQPAAVFQLFKTAAFRKKAGIEKDALSSLAACMQKLGFSVNYDAFIEKVIASWARAPRDGIELVSSDAASIGRALFVIRQLLADLKALHAESVRQTSEWVKLLRAFLEAYFAGDEEQEMLSDALTYLAQSAQKAKLESASFTCIKTLFIHAVEAAASYHAASVYAPIIFASLGEYLPLSCDMICLLGMNEESFPRESGKLRRQLGFLYTDKLPLRAYAIERHLFLSALLTAKKRFIISYQSYSYEDRAVKPPASFIQDLLQTLDETCTIEGRPPASCLVCTHALDSLNPASKPIEAASFVKKTTLVSERLYIHELSQVAKYPLRPYFQKNLGLYLRDFESGLAKSEFEAQDSMAYARLKKEAFFLSNDDAPELIERQYGALAPLLKSAVKSSLEEELCKLKANAASMGIALDERMSLELTLSCKKPVQLGPNSWKVPALVFDIRGFPYTLEGRLANVHPQGFLF